MATIRVDFYKTTGKWYAGGNVDVGETGLWSMDAFKQVVVDNQEILGENWQGGYYVVTSNCDHEHLADKYSYNALFEPISFIGIDRTCMFFGKADGMEGVCVDCYHENRIRFEKCMDKKYKGKKKKSKVSKPSGREESYD